MIQGRILTNPATTNGVPAFAMLTCHALLRRFRRQVQADHPFLAAQKQLAA